MSKWLLTAGLNGLLALILGAFGAHGLIQAVENPEPRYWDMAVTYQLMHAIVFIGIAWLSDRFGGSSRLPDLAGLLLLAGVVLFPGNLYLLGADLDWPTRALTPIGGFCLMGGWSLIAYMGYKVKTAAL